MSKRGRTVIYSTENSTDSMANDFDVKVKLNGGIKNGDDTKTDDRANIALLVFLYVLQGIPLGLAGSIPMVLQGKHIGYKQQAMFSLVYWPFSVKLLWAPIVDAAYFSKFGRRKSWLVPMQYLIGFFMLFLAQYVNDLLDDRDDKVPDVTTLTAVFFLLNFFAATQDIAVDGWALTMLSRRNVGHASTCNTIGQTAGYFIGNVVFLALSSAEFTNKFRSVPQAEGLVTLSGFLNFWGVIFLTTTTLVWLLKHEKAVQYTGESDDVLRRGIIGTYKLAWKIMKLPVVIQLVIILVTCKVGFAGPDSVTGLKLIEAGVPKETLAMLAIPMIPIQILLPLVISRFTAGPRALDVFLKAYPCRLFMGLLFAGCVYWAHHVRPPGVEDYPVYFYATIVLVYAVHQVFLYAMFVSCMGFYARVSDPAIGGTYMTLLNTVSNLGGSWSSTAALWFVDGLTKKECVGAGEPGLQCYTKDELLACEGSGGKCVILTDGYYIECIVCVVLGLIWLKVLGNRTRKLQDVDDSAWKCT